MDPTTTFKEAARILKKGGIFVGKLNSRQNSIAFDCDWPPSIVNWKAEKLYDEFEGRVFAIGNEHKLYDGVLKLDKSGHLQRMEDSKQFSFVKEVTLHNEDLGTAQRFINLALSQGGISTG
jgi:hypothetical protein